MFHRRPSPLRATLTLFLSVAFLCLLFLPAKDEENLLLFFDWHPEVEPLLIIAFVATLTLAGRRLRTLWRWIIAILVFAAALLQFAEAEVLSFFDRDLDLYFDLPHVPNLVGLFYGTAGSWYGGMAITATALGGLALIALIAWMLGAVDRVLKPQRHAAICLGIVLPLIVLMPFIRAGGGPLLGVRTALVVGHQMARLYRAWAVLYGYDTRYAAALSAPQPPLGELPRLKHRDVYIVFFESYGTVTLDDPRYAAVVAPALADFSATVENAGYHLLSNRVVSPTFGGGSWLAHGTIDSGLKFDQLLSRLVLDSQRAALPRYMAAAGYRTVEVMPGLKRPLPEDKFWGFAKSYYATDLGYDGPPFGWFDIPDQYTLRRFGEVEAGPGHSPLFAQLVLVSSHTPFAPVPPYVEDWADAGAFESVTPEQWTHIYGEPDWSHLEASYLDSVVYDLRTLGAWLARLDGDALVVILGDHQPPGFISGEKQPWTVPIHVLSRDPDLVLPFAKQGFVRGHLPPPEGSFKGMESFLGDFLAAFSGPPAVVATHPDTAESVAN